MSTLVVEVCEVRSVDPHPRADALEFITVKGWPVIVPKSLHLQVGDRVVYFPPDTVMPPELADRLGIARYLAPLPREIDGSRKPGLRVRAARLRGEASYGTIDHAVDPTWEVGRDVRDHYGVTKFEPPARPTNGDALPDLPSFPRYTEIESLRNFPDVLRVGEEVVITEKLHGKNARLGYVRAADGVDSFGFAAGSGNVRRREVDAKGRPSDFWLPMTANVRDLLRTLAEDDARSVVLYGELIGSGVQDMAYGFAQGHKAFRAFDLAVNGRYLDHDERRAWLDRFGIDAVPHLYRGPFSWAVVDAFTDGPTTLCPAGRAGRFAGREGCVITPTSERYDPGTGGSGRVIFKSVSADYLARKGGTDDH